MKTIKILQKDVTYPNDIKPEIARVYCFKKDGQLRFVATNSFMLIELKEDSLINDVFEQLPDKFYFSRFDVLSLKKFESIRFTEFENDIIFFESFSTSGKKIQSGQLKIYTDIGFPKYKHLFQPVEELTSESDGLFNYKYINTLGKLLADYHGGIDLKFTSNGSLQIDTDKGRGLLMKMLK